MVARTSVSRRDLLTFGARPSSRDGLIHIASLLVQAQPHARDAVLAGAAQLPGAETHDTPHPGKLVIVLETAEQGLLADAANALLQIPGVLTVSIVSHLVEEASALEEEMTEEALR